MSGSFLKAFESSPPREGESTQIASCNRYAELIAHALMSAAHDISTALQ
jgi:hypothetical protein